MIEVALAGPAAQVIAAPDSWSPKQGHHFGRGDYDIANNLASSLNGSRETVSAHLNYLETATNALVKRYWDAIEKVAVALLEKGTLDWDQLCETILDSEGLTPMSLSGKLEIGEAKRRRMLPPAGTGENIALSRSKG